MKNRGSGSFLAGNSCHKKKILVWKPLLISCKLEPMSAWEGSRAGILLSAVDRIKLYPEQSLCLEFEAVFVRKKKQPKTLTYS